MNIADIQASVSLYLETGTFEAEAAKVGESAGATVGASMSGKIKASLGSMALAGVGLEIGKQIVGGLETAFSKIADIIPGMIAQGQAFALNVQDITVKTGASAETASRFAGTLTYLGQSTDGLGQMLKTLSVQVVTNEAQFKKLGIATRDSGGNMLDTITILGNLRSYLSGAGDGATKLALATHLLGKSAGNLIEYLDLTNKQAAFLNTMMDNLAVTMGGDAVAAAVGLKREENLLGLAWQGLSETLLTAVVPALRQFIGGVIEFVAKNGPALRQMLSDITNNVLGFASALLGVSGITPFQTQMDSLGGSTGKVTLSFDQWTQQMGYTVPKIAAVASGTKAGTSAIDKQITALTALDKQQDKTYKNGLAGLNAQLDAQLKLMDAQDQALARANQDKQLTDALRQAKLDLAKAQAQAQQDAAGGKSPDSGILAIATAQQSVLDAQAAIADQARTNAEDDRRAQIQGVKDFITSIDKIVSDSTNSKTTLADLVKRQKALQAGGPAAPGSDRGIELAAVLAAETRVKQQAANTDKQSALDAAKSTASAVGAVQTTANAQTLATLKAQYAKYLADLKAGYVALAADARHSGEGLTGKGGLGDAMTKAFSAGVKGATDLKAAFAGLLPVLGSVVDAIAAIPAEVDKDRGALAILLTLAAAVTKNPLYMAAALALSASATTNKWDPLESILGLNGGSTTPLPQNPRKPAPGTGGKGPPQVTITNPLTGGSLKGALAAGGPASAGMLYRVNEVHTEYFRPNVSGMVIPLGPTGGDSPVIIRVEAGGNQLLDYIDRGLKFRRR